MNRFDNEVKQRWGDTAAYQEYAQKTISDTASDGLMAIFADFATCKAAGEPADGAAAQTLVQQLQDYITAHFYTCTNTILAGLGQMYVADQRFQTNIDRYGAGTAEYAANAIAVYSQP